MTAHRVRVCLALVVTAAVIAATVPLPVWALLALATVTGATVGCVWPTTDPHVSHPRRGRTR